MPFKISPLHKKLQDPLICPGNRTRKLSPHLLIPVQKRRGQHQIANPDRRSNGPGKGPNINHLLVSVTSLQRRNWSADIPEIAVIVVLYDISAFPLRRPLQKLLTPSDGHDCSQGILMRRHYISDIRAGRSQLLHIHPIPVHGDCAAVIAQPLKDLICMPVGGTLHGDSPVRPQHPGQKHLQIITSCADDHLGRLHVHPPGLMQIGADHGTQAILPLRISQTEQLPLVLAEYFPAQLPPDGIRLMLQIGSAGRKIIPAAALFRLLVYFFFCCFRIQMIQLLCMADKITSAGHRLHISF